MKCLKCDKRVVEFGLQLKDGSHCIKPGSKFVIEYESENSFVTCPHCKAKNILALIDTPSGPGKLYLALD
jgi:DNA-directed RNA polymerase subunit RPC12/RpoP